MTSGWMRIRGVRRRRALDRGFVLSDRADWPGLLDTIQDSGAEKLYLLHGSSEVLVRYLNEIVLEAFSIHFPGEVWPTEEDD